MLQSCSTSQTVGPEARPALLREYPEDLGRVYREEDNLQLDPASIWQSESVKRSLLQLDLGLFTVGFNQCCFGAPYKKPTRIISNIPGLQSWGYSGWPQFDEANAYLGPIRSCGCQTRITLAKRSNSESFRTTGTSAYPAQMDESLAQAVVLALKSMLSSPSEGGRQESIDGSKRGPEAKMASGRDPGVVENPGKKAKTAGKDSGVSEASEDRVSLDGSRAIKAPEDAVSHKAGSSGVLVTSRNRFHERFQAQVQVGHLRYRRRFFPRTEGRGRSQPGS